jgi:hypothetical protein
MGCRFLLQAECLFRCRCDSVALARRTSNSENHELPFNRSSIVNLTLFPRLRARAPHVVDFGGIHVCQRAYP